MSQYVTLASTTAPAFRCFQEAAGPRHSGINDGITHTGGINDGSYLSCLRCLGPAIVLQREGQGQQQDGQGELQERGPGAGARRRGLLGPAGGVLGDDGVGELGRDGSRVDLADAVLRHQLLGGVGVADVLEIGGGVLSCARRRRRRRRRR